MARSKSDLGSFTEPALLILVSLAAGPKHGYAMMDDISRIAEVKIGPGTLYGALARLEQRGYIRPLEADDRRRPYQITAAGSAVLREQLSAMESFANTGLARLRPT
ncbi:MAG: PadR family transcriptional regulator [Thermomicrobiales bacterium]